MIRFACCLLLAATLNAAEPLRLGVAGLAHGHVAGFFRKALTRSGIQIVGIAEPDETIRSRYAAEYKLDSSLLFKSVVEMLDRTKPEAVVIYTDTFDHKGIVELCAARHIPVMMEKPLAVSIEDGKAIAAAAKRGGIPVLVNYETTWYPNNQIIWSEVKERKSIGDIRKVVVRDGHEGPKEIGVPPEFFRWLSDPVRNGAGALFDFGCYGANLMTWLMDNQKPTTVTAVTQQIKPEIYRNVDDDATIILTYPHAQAVLQASWNWPFSRKDMDIYGQHGYIQTIRGEAVRIRRDRTANEDQITASAYPAPYDDSISYFTAVVRGRIQPSGLSSLENNLIVTEILDAARRSAKTGTTVRLLR